MTSTSWEVIFLWGLISTYYAETFDDPVPFKTAPSVPNITSPLPHCMLLSGLSVFDSYSPSASCGHVSPSSVPPLSLPCTSVLFVQSCWVEPGRFGVLIIFTPASHLLTCSDHVTIQLLTPLQFCSLCPASFAKPLKNLKFPRSTHLTSFMKTCLPSTYLIRDPWDYLFSLPLLLVVSKKSHLMFQPTCSLCLCHHRVPAERKRKQLSTAAWVLLVL